MCSSLADVSVGSVARARVARGTSGPDSVVGCCWVQLLTGVPTLVLSVGSPRRRRELTLIVADRSTGLPLWKDRINSMSSFRELSGGGSASSGVTERSEGTEGSGSTGACGGSSGAKGSRGFGGTGKSRGTAGSGGSGDAGVGAALTMRVSGGLTKRVRFDVFSRCAAVQFMTAYRTLTADPADQLWNISHDAAPTNVSSSPVSLLMPVINVQNRSLYAS